MALGLLVFHLQTKNRKAALDRRHWGATAPDGETQTYEMAFPTAGPPRNCSGSTFYTGMYGTP